MVVDKEINMKTFIRYLIFNLIVISILHINYNLYAINNLFAEDNPLYKANLTSGDVITSLMEHNYYFIENDQAEEVVLQNNTFPYVMININSKLSISNKFKITISFPRIYYAHIITDANKVIVNQQLMQSLIQALKPLPCSGNVDFLKSNFMCMKKYYIAYQTTTDFLEPVRKLFGIPSAEMVTITIMVNN